MAMSGRDVVGIAQTGSGKTISVMFKYYMMCFILILVNCLNGKIDTN